MFFGWFRYAIYAQIQMTDMNWDAILEQRFILHETCVSMHFLVYKIGQFFPYPMRGRVLVTMIWTSLHSVCGIVSQFWYHLLDREVSSAWPCCKEQQQITEGLWLSPSRRALVTCINQHKDGFGREVLVGWRLPWSFRKRCNYVQLPKLLQDMNCKQESLMGVEVMCIYIWDLILTILVLLPATCRVMI